MENLTPEQVRESFIAAPPLVSQTIYDLSVKHPIWLRDVFETAPWPNGQGTVMQQLVFRGARPQIERGFDKWKKVANTQGCNPCEGPDCSYNWSTFGGYGFERKLTELMRRDFKSPEYCIHEIETTQSFMEVFAKVVENLYAQVDFFKEFNVAQNFLTMIAKKYIVDSGGAKPNPNDPYVYRPVGTARLSTLNINMLEFVYEHLRRLPDCIPYDVVDGRPVYALEASDQLLSRLYLDNTELRQDIRFSGFANDLLMKYNFMTTIRGMFIPAPILYPRRFNVVAGELVEVLPFENDIEMEVGAYTGTNQAYEAATHEEVTIHGKYPFKIFYKETAQTLGEGTSFGPEYSFMNQWSFINPLTKDDPMRRVGYFATNAEIGLSQQFSSGVFAFAVERPSVTLMAMYTPNPVCPVAPPECTNVVPTVDCPCPLVTSFFANPMVSGNYFVTFSAATEGEVDADVVFQLDNGAEYVGTLVLLSEDGKTAEIAFDNIIDCKTADQIIGIYCADATGCSAIVDKAYDCRSGETGQVKLILSNAIKARTVGDKILAYFGDCTTALLEIVSVDATQLEWIVNYADGYGPTDDPAGSGDTLLSADMICDRKGITRVCVPPSTDAACPACEPTITACSGNLA